MNVMMKSECCPLGWKRSLLVPLHKDGDVEQVGNYRRIPSGCSVGRVFVRVLSRLGRFAENRILTEAQGGLGSDQWLVPRDICEVQKKREEEFISGLPGY